MKKPRIVIGILVSLLLMLGLALPVAAEVDPTEVIRELEPGESIEVTKNVTTPEIPPLIDILLLEDETGSFYDDIGNLQTLAPAIWDAIAASGADFTMGVAGFRDFAQPHPYTYPPWPWGGTADWVYRLPQDLTTDKTAFQAGVDSLTAGGGQDTPEAQLEALHYLATPTHAAIDSDGDGDTTDSIDTPTGLQPTWRLGAVRVVLLATDAGCHVNTDSARDGAGLTVYWPGDSGTTSANVTGSILAGAGIVVIGLTPGGAGTITCIDDLARETGGSVHATTDTGEDIKEAILAGLEALTTDVWWEVETDDGLTVTLSPDKYLDVEGETTVSFTETITVAKGTWHCEEYTATVTFYANSYDVGEGGVVGVQTIVIHVVGPVKIDIKPQSCPNPLNVKGKGVLPVAIVGTAGFDVTQIDVSTVTLEGVNPIRSSIEDVATPYDGEISDPPDRGECTTAGPDGIADLTLKFDKQAIVAALGPVSDGDVLVLELTGNLLDGTDIFGADVVWILKKGKK